MIGRNNRKMNCLVCVLWCLIFNVSSGQLNGDPAPGRSPGPPSDATGANTIWTKTNSERSNLNTGASPNDIAISIDNYDDGYHRSSDDIHQVPQNTLNRKVMNAVLAPKPIRQPDKLVDKLTNEFVNHKPCKNLSVNEYLLMKKHSPEIVKVEKVSTVAAATGPITNNETATSSSSSPASVTSSIRIDVAHNVFNLNYGLVRNVIYTGNNYPYYICIGIFNLLLYSIIAFRSPQFSTKQLKCQLDAASVMPRLSHECISIVYAERCCAIVCLLSDQVVYVQCSVPLSHPKSSLFSVLASLAPPSMPIRDAKQKQTF